uniref:DNA-directed RNA polymerase III subunit RPC9 n=1 Tax=Riptortus pedestris TaxID=329032 RepID=R4WE74_RIPPE|nr:unkown protein [Riptortus pedestris]
MEIKSAKVGSLCNFEVLNLLNELKFTRKNNVRSGSQLATVVYEASQYLQHLNIGQNEVQVRNLLKELSSFPVRLTYNEKLMIVNTLPRTSLELSLLINGYDDRLTEEQIHDLLGIISRTSPEPI